ncbi:MAG: hypothetical protein N2Z22_09615, partial [Turneriella sp.]|nr:hypothetical protein [Turneriella sp.]
PKTGVITIESQGRADFLPKDSRYERVHSLRGLWILEPKAEGKRVHITMIGHTDPGGFIPAAIANHFVVLIPFNTIKNLRRQLKKEKYANAKFDYIRD